MEIKTVTKELFETYIDDFCQLYEVCFKQKMTHEEVRWRYLEHPNKDIIACFAFDNNKLIANYAASPVEMNVNGENVNAILALNTMTHPDYWGKGLFVQLANRVYDEALQKGYKFAICFPNYLANRICVSKLGWKDLYEIPTLELNLDSIQWDGFVGGQADIVEDSCFQLDYSDCCSNVMGMIFVNKSREYLRWRYARNPINKYTNFVVQKDNKVSSYIICKEYRERLNIIDYHIESTDEMENLFAKCIEHGLALGKKLITVWAKIGEKEHLHLEKLGFRNNYPITYFSVRELVETDLDIYDYRKWTVQMGDDNVY